jgi:hypothetical protein
MDNENMLDIPDIPNILDILDIPNIPYIPAIELLDIPAIELPPIPDIELLDIPNIELPPIPDIELLDIPNIELPPIPDIELPFILDIIHNTEDIEDIEDIEDTEDIEAIMNAIEYTEDTEDINHTIQPVLNKIENKQLIYTILTPTGLLLSDKLPSLSRFIPQAKKIDNIQMEKKISLNVDMPIFNKSKINFKQIYEKNKYYYLKIS